MSRKVPFSIDAMWAIRTLLKLHFDKNYNFNDDHTIATRYSLSEILYTTELTDEEINIIFKRYADNHNLGTEISLTGEPEQVKEVFNYLFDLPRYQNEHWKNIIAGHGPYKYSVIDISTKKEYECKNAGHYGCLIDVIRKDHYDKFNEMDQKERDNFILTNFRLIGKSNDMDWYLRDIEYYV